MLFGSSTSFNFVLRLLDALSGINSFYLKFCKCLVKTVHAIQILQTGICFPYFLQFVIHFDASAFVQGRGLQILDYSVSLDEIWVVVSVVLYPITEQEPLSLSFIRQRANPVFCCLWNFNPGIRRWGYV